MPGYLPFIIIALWAILMVVVRSIGRNLQRDGLASGSASESLFVLVMRCLVLGGVASICFWLFGFIGFWWAVFGLFFGVLPGLNGLQAVYEPKADFDAAYQREFARRNPDGRAPEERR